jgi:hypothetical protein
VELSYSYLCNFHCSIPKESGSTQRTCEATLMGAHHCLEQLGDSREDVNVIQVHQRHPAVASGGEGFR